MMRFSDYLATLPHADQVRLLIAGGAGLREARLASEVVTGNGDMEDMRRHVAAALAHLEDVAMLIGLPGRDKP